MSQAVFGKTVSYVIRNIVPTEQYKYASVPEFNSGRLQNYSSVPVEVGLDAPKFRIPDFFIASVYFRPRRLKY